MQNTISIFLLFIGLTMFTSCKKEVQTLSSTEGDMTITVTATRYVAEDPWTVTVELKIPDLDRPIKTQRDVMARSISEENVKFIWRNKTMCIVSITQTDGSLANIPVRVER